MLGVKPGSGVDEVRTAFRRAALRTHPDKPGGSCEAFNAVQCAYEALVGQGSAAALLGDWATQASDAFAASGVAAPAAAASSASVDPWSTETFDPWNTATFDPWSASTWDPWSAAEAAAPA